MTTQSDFDALKSQYNDLLLKFETQKQTIQDLTSENHILRQKYELGTNDFVLIGLEDFQVTYVQDNPDTFDLERKYLITDFYINHVKTDSRRFPLSAFPDVPQLENVVHSDPAPELVESLNE